MARANLRDLPEELVSNISARLWIDDAQALRLTCKALESKTLHEFATEYFSERAFIISTASLQVLVSISNNAKLRGFLRRLHIVTAYFSDSAFKCGPSDCPHGHTCGWQPTTRQSEAWKFLVQDAKDLKASGKDKEILCQALANLPGLEDVNIADAISPIPINADISMARKVPRLCGRNFQLPTDSKPNAEYHAVLSHVWSILTTAVAGSKRSTLKHFSTSLGKGINALCIPLNIRFSDAKINQLKPAFQNLESVNLNLTTRLNRYASKRQMDNLNEHAPQRLQRLASVFPALRGLMLDFDGSETDSVLFNNLTPYLDLSKMRTLQLYTLTVDRKSLMAVFARLESIQELMLSYVDLSRGSWIPILKQMQGMDGHLQHLHLMYLLESGKKVFLLAQPNEGEQMEQEDVMTFEDFLGAPPGEFDDENEDETDDDLPPLETMDGVVLAGDNAAPPHTAPPAPTIEDDISSSSNLPPAPSTASKAPKTDAPMPETVDDHASFEYKAPGNEKYPERGYYVCIRGKEVINKELKTFIQQYNIGEDITTTAPAGFPGGFMGGAMAIPVPAGHPPGQPPTMNHLLNGLAGALGLPPMPGQNGGGQGLGAGGGHHGAGGGHHGAGGGHHGAGGGHHGAGAHAGAAQFAAADDDFFVDAFGPGVGPGVGPGPTPFGGPPPPASAAAAPPAAASAASPATAGGAQMEEEWDTAESSEYVSESDGEGWL